MVNYYAPCDVAIKAMNREIVEEFGRLKMSKWDDINVIRTVVSLYRKSAKKARKRYWEVAYEAYILGMILAEVDTKEARKMADKSITMEWVDQILDETNFADDAVIQSFKDAGVERVQWLTSEDERTCHACNELHGMEFPIGEIPAKPHYGCRCRLKPIE